MALAHGAKEVLFLRQLLQELRCRQGTTTVMADNQSAQALASNPVHHQRSKHIDVGTILSASASHGMTSMLTMSSRDLTSQTS
jgi:hypothetical protein